jgi:hypothetical protein
MASRVFRMKDEPFHPSSLILLRAGYHPALQRRIAPPPFVV